MTHLTTAFMIVVMRALIIGLTTKLPRGITQLSLDGVQMAIADIVSRVQENLGIYEAVPANHSAYKKSLEVRRERKPSAEKLVNDLHAALLLAIGTKNEDLKDFGFRPVKARPEMTADQKVERAKKSKATRAARHTMGKRQKAQIHGNDAQGNPAPKA